MGAEALIRWTHPQRGELSPLDFIPIAERNGLIGSVSRWVLGRLVRDLSSIDGLLPQLRVYFNLSVQDLEDFALLDAMDDALTKHPHLAQVLGVEITESAAMKNVEQALNTLGLFRQMGIHVAIDDFGTGYSSLSYLKRLAVDMIKIDRSFVMGLPDDDQDAALAETMIGICSRFNLRSLAEGIETEAQCAWLLAHGCRLGQGYLVSKPLTFAQFVERAQPAPLAQKMA